jgi:hypothetical protein
MIWIVLCFALAQVGLAMLLLKIYSRVVRIDRRLATSNHFLADADMHRLEEASRHARA